MSDSKIKIKDLATELKMDAKELLQELQSMGFNVKSAQGSIPMEEVSGVRDRVAENRQRKAGRNGLYGLRPGHGGSHGKIAGAGGNAAISSTRHGCARNSHIDRHHGTPRRCCHAADAGAAGNKIFEHRAGHGGICLADPLRDNAVIRAEHQHGTLRKGRGGIPGQGRRVLYHRFQCAQPAQRFRQRRPMCMGGSAGRFIRRGYGAQQGHKFIFGHVLSFI